MKKSDDAKARRFSGGTALHFPAESWRDVIVFLDFDGTLVDLAETPMAVVVPGELPGLLDDLRDRLPGGLFLLSGRDVDTLSRFLPGFGGDMIGSHGAERRVEGMTRRHPLAGSSEVHDIWRAIDACAAGHPGIIAEHKPTGGVLHYRQAPGLAGDVRNVMERLAGGMPRFELHQAKMALELRPRGIGKVDVLREVLAGTGGRVPVIFGDDVTDEPALAFARECGGLAVKVGQGHTAATHRLDTPAEVRATLRRWLDEVR